MIQVTEQRGACKKVRLNNLRGRLRLLVERARGFEHIGSMCTVSDRAGEERGFGGSSCEGGHRPADGMGRRCGENQDAFFFSYSYYCFLPFLESGEGPRPSGQPSLPMTRDNAIPAK